MVKLALVHMDDQAVRFPADIGDGLRKRVAIARALTMKPRYVIFDEPTTGLDPLAASRVDALIRSLREEAGVTAIVVSHDMASAFRVADQIAFLHEGEIRACGPPDVVSANPDPWVRRFIYAGTPEGDKACQELGLEH